MVYIALPEPFNATVPSVLPSSLKVTVPVGAPKPSTEVFTVTVKVTELPEREGLRDEVSLVEVPAFATT